MRKISDLKGLSVKEHEMIVSGVNRILGNDTTGHDTEHALHVYQLATKIALIEGKDNYLNLRDVQLAALLHDVDDHKLSPQTCENKDHAREILKMIDCDDTTMDRVCEIIDGISWSKNKDKKPKDLTVACVQDADRMSAIGSMGIVRACRYGGAVGMPMQESIDHFYEKLLDVRDKLNTNTAKQISRPAQKIMIDFLKEYHTSVGETYPEKLIQKSEEYNKEIGPSYAKLQQMIDFR